MLAELLEHDHGQQARSRPSPRDDMERRRRLADLLAVPAGELLPHRLAPFPPTGRRFQRPGHVFAELAHRRSTHTPPADRSPRARGEDDRGTYYVRGARA